MIEVIQAIALIVIVALLLRAARSAVTSHAGVDPPPAKHDDDFGSAEDAYKEGRRLEDQGNLIRAEAAYRHADKGGHALATFRRGLLMEQRGELVGAMASYRRAVKRGEAAAGAHLARLLEQGVRKPPPSRQVLLPPLPRPAPSTWGGGGETTWAPPASPTDEPHGTCPADEMKRIFDTEDDAWRAVHRSRERFERGERGYERPLDHAYLCRAYDHWHVSSQPTRLR